MAMLVGMWQQAPNEQSQLTITHICSWHDPGATLLHDCSSSDHLSATLPSAIFVVKGVLHGESNTGQVSPRTPTQRTIQPQEAAQPQRSQTILQPDTPAQKANYSYKWSHPTPHEAYAHMYTSHVHKNTPSRWAVTAACTSTCL